MLGSLILSFLGLIFRILSGNPKKELLSGLWVRCRFRAWGLGFKV